MVVLKVREDGCLEWALKGIQQAWGCRRSLEGPLERVQGRKGGFLPPCLPVLTACHSHLRVCPGLWAGALLGHVAAPQGGRRVGGSLGTTSPWSLRHTLKISVAAEGLLPFLAQIPLFSLTWD